jgi:prepilin signal peptidase PulO-like enzyme (type II secretory pathway)
VGFTLLRGRCRVCRTMIPRRHLTGELTVGVLWALSVVWLGLTWWLPLVLLAPVLVVLLRSGAVRGAGWQWWSAAVLPPLRVAVPTLGVGAALASRGWLYAARGAAGAAALLGAAQLTGEKPAVRLSQTPTGPHLPRV